MACLTCNRKLPQGQWFCGSKCVQAEVERHTANLQQLQAKLVRTRRTGVLARG